MNYGLPKSLEVCGVDYAIRYDFRAVLDIFVALNDRDLTDEERCLVALSILYIDFDDMPREHYQEARDQCLWFLNGGGESEEQKGAPLVSWEQDFQLMVAPINRVYGQDIRAVEYDPEANTGGVHWWTFLSCYMEIGDCLFAQIVRIREKKREGKKLDKSDSDFYKKNKKLIDLKTNYSEAENSLVEAWT
jgi:hypothetical protein